MWKKSQNKRKSLKIIISLWKKESHKNSETSEENWKKSHTSEKMSQASVKICQTSEKFLQISV